MTHRRLSRQQRAALRRLERRAVLVSTLFLLAAVVIGAVTVGGGGGVLPSTAIVLSAGACPGTTTEYTAARGRYVVGVPSGGTIAGTLGTAMANGPPDVSYTPAGTVAAPTFTGSALGTHQHEGTFAGFDATRTLTRLNAFGSGTTRTYGASITYTLGDVADVALLTQAIAAGTPAGTNDAPAFTGTANATLRSSVAPAIQLRLCQQ